MAFAIAHNDADGLGCIYALFKANASKKFKVYFTPLGMLKKLLCSLIMKYENLDEIYVCDLSPDRVTVALTSAFQKATWLDHHKNNVNASYPNVELVIKQGYPSAAQVVAEYFGLKDDFIKLINEIDTNSVKSDEAAYLRDLVGAIKWKFNNNFAVLNSKMKGVLKKVLHEGIEGLERDLNNALLIEEFKNWLEKMKDLVDKKARSYEVNGYKIVVFESTTFVPTYFVYNYLKEKENFDLLAMLIHKPVRNRIMTKIDLRGSEKLPVIGICKALGGGGHEVACGATTEFMSGEEFIKFLKERL